MDQHIALIVFVGLVYYFYQRNILPMLAWVVITYLVARNALNLNRTFSVLLGIAVVYVVARTSVVEGFEDEEKEDTPKEPKPKTSKSTDPHVDLGTTILHAYRNLTPEQIGGMRRDTKELMELQKELMGTLAEMKPAIEQGAQLLGTFTQFFGQ